MTKKKDEVEVLDAVINHDDENKELVVPASTAVGAVANDFDDAYEDSDFEGMGNVQTFLPGVTLNTSGKFEFRNMDIELDELNLTPLSGRDVWEYWDDDNRVFYKSYDGKTLEQPNKGDSFEPWAVLAKMKYEVEFEHDLDDGNGAQIFQLRLSTTAAIALKQFAKKLFYLHGKKLNEVVIRLKAQRAVSKKNIKYWTAAVECDQYVVPEGTYTPAMMTKFKQKQLAK